MNVKSKKKISNQQMLKFMSGKYPAIFAVNALFNNTIAKS